MAHQLLLIADNAVAKRFGLNENELRKIDSAAPLRRLAPPGLRFAPSKMPPALGIFQELMGHSDVRTTMIYTHLIGRQGVGAGSPLD